MMRSKIHFYTCKVHNIIPAFGSSYFSLKWKIKNLNELTVLVDFSKDLQGNFSFNSTTLN